MDGLLERTVSFAYDYKVTCRSCTGTSPLASSDYHHEINEAHMDCAHCGADVHFGPAVFALRDAEDPALDDQWVGRAAWYHTSTDGDWPYGTHTMPTETKSPIARLLSPDGLKRARERYENQALHLGTYEAAIESMLRRMHNQADGGSQFYIYRVRLREGLSVEAGWRDENHAEAAQITQQELGAVEAIRYLNVHESPGSISLAVRRGAIDATQRVALPVAAPGQSTRDLLTEVALLRAQIDEMEVHRPAALDLIDQLGAEGAARRGTAFVRSPSPEQYALLDGIDALLEDRLLPDASCPVKSAFTRALGAWRHAQYPYVDDAAYIQRFAALAATVHDPDAILRALVSKPIQELRPWQP
ncbi:hypothetical protein [Geodermatophilus sp. DSM 45219]|uniref:hypothetical protein n=1 Tax=Geodermatophilus sp. DSM 45219 TaxID=1881103 RepID=UPI00088B2CBF|nr:hypothetical protein [Geodermatophilus sp. DSM 45219]SDO16388.1 hypothetical protein SAMN05428965_2956 [Geodermatophilus sp. DSM 45219]